MTDLHEFITITKESASEIGGYLSNVFNIPKDEDNNYKIYYSKVSELITRVTEFIDHFDVPNGSKLKNHDNVIRDLKLFLNVLNGLNMKK